MFYYVDLHPLTLSYIVLNTVLYPYILYIYKYIKKNKIKEGEGGGV